MNIFEQYGIKEVADVTLYSIELDENDDEIYIPVLYLDTLKVSTVEETAEQTSARGGLGNPELIIWDYGKEITVTLEDALYTPASMGMTWGGKFGTKHFKVNGTYAYDENANESKTASMTFDTFSEFTKGLNSGGKTTYSWTTKASVVSVEGCVREVGTVVLTYIDDSTLANQWLFGGAMGSTGVRVGNGYFVMNPETTNFPSAQDVIYQINHALENVYLLDRMEKCIATKTFAIRTDVNTQQGNYRYLEKYSQCELAVYIDPRTMEPYESNATSFTRASGAVITGDLRIIKQNEIYYKWTRSKAQENTSLGSRVTVDATHFPGTYRLVGETYSRNRKTNKDMRFQFEIPLCKMGTENSFSFEAEGDPTTFTMSLKVLRRFDGVMMKLTQYDVDSAKYDGQNSASHDVVPIDEVMPSDPISGSV